MNTNKYQENLNKKIEETIKSFEKMFDAGCSYHEENKWGRKNGIFTIKLKSFNKTSEDVGKFFSEGIEIFTSRQENQMLTIGQQINATIDSRGLSECAVSVEVKKGKKVELVGRELSKNKLIEENMKDDKSHVSKSEESLNRHFIDNGDSLTYSVEGKDKNGVVKETYTESNRKEPKQEIIDKENKQGKAETSSNSDKKDKKSEKETKEQDFSQKPDNKDKERKENNLANDQQSSLNNKDNNSKGIYYGIGAVCLVVLAMSIFWSKKRKK